MQLTSPAFSTGEVIPDIHTCSGANVSPELMWTEPPAGTKSFALIVEDPDAREHIHTHWLVYNISPRLQSLHANISNIVGASADCLMQGENDFGVTGYGGPCPPSGDRPHRYFFRLYALDDRLDLEPGATRAELEKAMLPRIIAQSELMGKYQVH